ncbi:hypothetical protein TSMG0022 [Halocynthia phage JM-2012]|uniref:hypothetical protein n=1 Tax=Halocynthia phage JM-2012 TaxID=1173297 RepID=UPI00025C68E5|nr:hypothetical protein TSMG0022 [Halocynthia phage JM-2012]AFI55305.1 hypothetical protein TSMG0022 [Halocynthia phage JM-2012]
MNEEQMKQVEVMSNKVKSETQILNKKCNNPSKINRLIALGLSSYIGFKVLDVPTDEGIIARSYYQTNLEPSVHHLVSMVNEHVLIDTKAVIDLTFKVWYQRLLLVRGEVTEKYIMDMLEESPVLSKEDQDCCDERSDLLL